MFEHKVTQLLFNHTSSETAYVVKDYPYGGLRCQIRYWLEYKPKKGFRFVSQTTNPRRNNEVFSNKPKTSTYYKFGAAMYLDDKGYVEWAGLSEYQGLVDSRAWVEQFGAAVPEIGQSVMKVWMATKERYEVAKQLGKVTARIGDGPIEIVAPEIPQLA